MFSLCADFKAMNTFPDVQQRPLFPGVPQRPFLLPPQLITPSPPCYVASNQEMVLRPLAENSVTMVQHAPNRIIQPLPIQFTVCPPPVPQKPPCFDQPVPVGVGADSPSNQPGMLPVASVNSFAMMPPLNQMIPPFAVDIAMPPPLPCQQAPRLDVPVPISVHSSSMSKHVHKTGKTSNFFSQSVSESTASSSNVHNPLSSKSHLGHDLHVSQPNDVKVSQFADSSKKTGVKASLQSSSANIFPFASGLKTRNSATTVPSSTYVSSAESSSVTVVSTVHGLCSKALPSNRHTASFSAPLSSSLSISAPLFVPNESSSRLLTPKDRKSHYDATAVVDGLTSGPETNPRAGDYLGNSAVDGTSAAMFVTHESYSCLLSPRDWKSHYDTTTVVDGLKSGSGMSLPVSDYEGNTAEDGNSATFKSFQEAAAAVSSCSAVSVPSLSYELPVTSGSWKCDSTIGRGRKLMHMLTSNVCGKSTHANARGMFIVFACTFN